MKKSQILFFAGIVLTLGLINCKKNHLPKVTTLPVTNITSNSVLYSGTVTDEGGSPVTERGICYSVFPSPNINNDRTFANAGTGNFGATLSGLSNNTMYYIKAYATNDAGTAYGDEMTFTTSLLPYVDYNGNTLFVYPGDNSANTVWGPVQVTSASSTTDGQTNTSLIDPFSGSYAAKICSQLNAYGFTDWYLPSQDELNALYINKNTIGNMNASKYWSSTETGSNYAISQDFFSGSSGSQIKSDGNGCRCIRKN